MFLEGVGDVFEEDQAEESFRTGTIVIRFGKMGCRHCLLGGEPELGLEAAGGGGCGGCSFLACHR